MIDVIFTCKGRPNLTELCLRRFVELMPPHYDLYICYDGTDKDYIEMLVEHAESCAVIPNWHKESRFKLINDALEMADAEYYMHLENDFYWEDPTCLDASLNAFYKYLDIDYIRFEMLPFTHKTFYKCKQVDLIDVCWMRENAPYRFTFNPHIRKFKYPAGKPLQEEGFTKQPEQHHNDEYKGVSCCLTGNNFRHLGIYDEGGYYKPYYAERFTLRRGEKELGDVVKEFKSFCDNKEYLSLWLRYLESNGHQHSA